MINYKSTLIFTFFIFATLFSKGQNKLYIIGIVRDSIGNSPVASAKISVLKNEQEIAIFFTDNEGRFRINNIDIDGVVLKVQAISYNQKIYKLLPQQNNDTLKFSILLVKQVNQLKEVVVKGDKKYIKQEIDRLSYNVKDDPESKTATMLDILRKVPMVSIGMNEKIEVNGRGTYTILLNGKPSSILTNDPAAYLNSLKAGIVDHIEVITTPASRFSQNGITEVINIITKEYEMRGMQANIRTTYSTLNNLNSTMNSEFKRGGVGISLYGNYLFNNPPNIGTVFQQTRNGSLTSNIVQNGVLRRKYNSLMFVPEISYEVDPLNLFLFSAEYRNSPGSSYEDITTQFNENGISQINNSLINSKIKQNNFATSLYYQHQGKRKKDRLISIGYRYNKPNSNTRYDIDANDSGNFNYNSQINELVTNEHTLQLDYVHPIKSVEIEGGVKNIFRNNKSFGSTAINGLADANTFLINNQDAIIVYNTYYWKRKLWGIKAGLRYESTLANNGTEIKSTYNNIIPTFNAQIKYKKAIWSFSYDQNIERPALEQLNNFNNQTNPAFQLVGNPNLKTAITHKLELNYALSLKFYLRFTGYYYKTDRDIINLILNNNGMNTLSYYNAGNKDDIGLRFNTNIKFFKKLNYAINARVSYVDYSADIDDVNNRSKGWEFFTTNNLSYLLKSGWRFDTYLRLSNPYVQPQGKSFWWIDNTYSINKKFFNSALNCSISIQNPFMNYRDRESSKSINNAFVYSNQRTKTRAAFFSVSYQLGHMRYEIKKNKKQIENNDLKTEALN